MYSETVTSFIKQGSRDYSARDFEQAAAHYADACAAFNEENGTDDADLLLMYGKALFQNGVARSEVLGGVQTAVKPPVQVDDDANDNGFHFDEGMAKDEAAVAEGHEESDPESEQDGVQGEIDEDEKENSDGSGEDAGDTSDNQEQGEEEEEQTDFEAAWEILDLSRALFEHKVDELKADVKSLSVPYLKSDKEEPAAKYVESLRKLSETYDLLGEVSLESENFPQAAKDLASCLELRQTLYDASTSSLVSESHYKLSLALEFCVEEPESRQKAADHVKMAIATVKARAAKESNYKGKDHEEKDRETQELLKDLQERYDELRRPPESELQTQQLDMIKGLLGEAVAGSSAGGTSSAANDLSSAVRRKLPVNDLSSMVKKRKGSPDNGQPKKTKPN